MYPCCAYDSGMFLFLDQTDGNLAEPDLHPVTLALGLSAAALCYAVLLALP